MTEIRYLDVCSGYSAFTVASEGLGFRCAGYSEIEPFPRAMLQQRHRAVAADWDHRFAGEGDAIPLFGDFTRIEAHHVGPVDLLTGGTPCQAFSLAGLRGGLADARGNLTLEFLRLAERVRARWLLWENVPGVFSALAHDAPHPRPPAIDLDGDGGPEDGEEIVVEDEYDADESHALSCFLAGLSELGYGWAYRVLDAQYVRVDGHARAVPQRRRRVFVVAHLGDAAGPAAVLFEPESLRGDPAPRRETGEGIARPIAAGSPGGSGYRNDVDTAENLIPQAFGGGNRSVAIDAAACLTAKGMRLDFEVETFVAQPIPASLTRGAESGGKGSYAGRRQEDDVNLVCHAFDARQSDGCQYGDLSPPLDTDGYTAGVAHSLRAEGFDASEDGTGRGTPIVPVQPYVFMERGRAEGRNLECRNDGTANSLVTPNGGRGGMGVGAIAFDTTQITSATNRSNPQPDGPCHPLARAQHPPAVAVSVSSNSNGFAWQGEVAGSLQARTESGDANQFSGVLDAWAVRRLTPTECERLMGVPDGFTAIDWRGKPAADGPRYKVLGNSQAINQMRWIARGLADVIAARRLAGLE